jgi:RHS repeat-associated protein
MFGDWDTIANSSSRKVDSGAAQYTYDALNHRVRSVVGSSTTEFVFNVNGQRVSDWNGTSHAQLNGKFYWGSVPLAYYDSATHFEHQDWEGTERMRTSATGSVEAKFTSLPWGDMQGTLQGADTDSYHYAGLDFDTESYTNHAMFRQHNPTQGRWTSPDPYAGSYNPSNPQTFNRYTYALNMPHRFTDATGLDTQCAYNSKGGIICWDDGSGGDPCATDFSVCTSGDDGGPGLGGGGGGGGGGRGFTPALPLDLDPTEVGGGGGGDPNNAPTVSHCLGVAAADKGVSIGLDVVGAIPLFGNATSATAGVVRAGIALNHAFASPAFAVGSGVYGAYGAVKAGPEEATDSLVGAGSAGAGIGLALADVAVGGTKAIPIVGNFVSVATLGWDGYQAYKKYQSCMAGH